MNDTVKYKPIPKTALNVWKLKLLAPLADGQTRNATLSVGVIRNNPRIDVFTQVPNDKDNGRISAPMDSPTMYALLEYIYEIADGPNDSRIAISNFQGRPSEKVKISTTIIGKDKEGKVYISVTADNRPKIKFVFAPSEYHVFSEKDGTPISEAKLSCIYAKTWAKLFHGLVINVLSDFYEDTSPIQGNNNSGGYNSNKSNNYKSNNYNKSSSNENFADMDDMPM